jgi:hypothetical protein
MGICQLQSHFCFEQRRTAFARIALIVLIGILLFDITTYIISRAPLHLIGDDVCNFLNTCRMATPLRGCKAPSVMYQRIRVTAHGMVLKMVHPGINDRFFINHKNNRDRRNWPCKSTQEPCKNIVRVWIVSLVHTLGFPYATASFTYSDG